ncbi:MAG: hypothetical protein GY788_09790, partial [bacterium]|nr:hypothetical protein [bacterium]
GGEPIDRVQYSTNGSTWHDLGNLSSPQNAGVGINNGNSYTVQLRACNIVGCGDSSPASGSATPFGSPSVSVSRSGQTLTWSWSEQAGVNNYTVARSGFTGGSKSGCCSFSRNFGFGPSRTFGLTVTANGPGGHSQSSGQVRGTVPDSRSISLSEGSPGSDNLGQGCGPGAGCVWFHIVTAGFPAGTYTVSCRVGGSQFFTDTISVPSSGVVNRDIGCLAGTGLDFTVEIDGVTSNVLLRR